MNLSKIFVLTILGSVISAYAELPNQEAYEQDIKGLSPKQISALQKESGCKPRIWICKDVNKDGTPVMTASGRNRAKFGDVFSGIFSASVEYDSPQGMGKDGCVDMSPNYEIAQAFCMANGGVTKTIIKQGD